MAKYYAELITSYASQRYFPLRLNRSEGQIYDVRVKSTMGGLNKNLTCREADLGALWFATSLPALRSDVRPIYVKIGILPELAAGIQHTSELSVRPEA